VRASCLRAAARRRRPISRLRYCNHADSAQSQWRHARDDQDQAACGDGLEKRLAPSGAPHRSVSDEIARLMAVDKTARTTVN
jgi:hypothetical protein